MVGKLKRVALREVWSKEASDFTVWMESNLEELNEALDFTIVSAEREQAAGSFSVDLVGEDEAGNIIIIENQLEKTNHDHLGKLITYLAAFQARAAVWVVSEPRPEHAAAIAWLNQTSLADFYLVKVEAVRIGDSDAAALFTRVVGPSDESRQVGKAKEEIAFRHVQREKFWTELIERSKPKTKLFTNKKPDNENWMAIGAGRSGLIFSYVLWKDTGGAAEFYIDKGKDSQSENLMIFEQLRRQQGAIEATFGSPLDWQELEGKRACRVRFRIWQGGWAEPDSWHDLQDRMIDAMIRLEKAFRPYVLRLGIDDTSPLSSHGT